MTAEKLKSLEPFFGKWYIESKVAEGKNSIIFKAFFSENGQKHFNALEVIKFPGSNEEISRALDSERFSTVDEYLSYAERRVCENIDKMLTLAGNKNIVRYEDYTVIKENSCFYVVILRELLTPLSDYIKNNRVKHKDVVKIGWDLCAALDAFRKAGILHRNIKPENIFVGDDSSYKLGDFGIDGMYRRKSGLESYRAPEVGTEHDNISSDIYSLGIVLYRLLNNNRAPFLPAYPAPVSLEDRERATTRRLRGDLFPVPANADSNLARIIFTATAFKPEDRYASPMHMRSALETYVKNIIAAPPVHEATVSVVGTHYVPAGSAKKPRSDGAISVTAGDKAAFAEAFRDDDEVSEEKNYKKWYIIIGILAVILAILVAVIIKTVSDKDNDTNSDISFSPSYYDGTTTTEPVTQEHTTEEEITTEEESTEAETTEEDTTEGTTEEETTEEPTEQETTEEPTEPETTEEPTVQTPDIPPAIQAGSVDSNGRVYYDLTGGQVVFPPQDESDKEIIIEISGVIGNEPKAGATSYIEMTYEGSSVLKSALAIDRIEKSEGDSYFCYMTVIDQDFFYVPEAYSYFVILSAGSIETDTSVNTQIIIEF